MKHNQIFKRLAILTIASFISANVDSRADIISEITPDGVLETVRFNDCFEDKEEKEMFEFEIGNYSFVIEKATSVLNPMYDPGRGFIIYPLNSVMVDTKDGSDMLSVGFEIESEDFVWEFINYGDETTVNSGKIDKTTGIWSGASPHVLLRFVNRGYEALCPAMKILVAGPEEPAMAMSLKITDAQGLKAGSGVISYELSVSNDDGVDEFMIEAVNADNEVSFGRFTVENDSETETYGDTEADNTTIYRGRIKLTQLNKNDITRIRVSAIAKYEGGKEISVEHPDIVEINTQGLPTSINEIEADAIKPVYFNLQGIRVDKPCKGHYIRRTGTRYDKVVMP